ncbi:MAG: preprotein translocase subunit YajC [Desulfobulbus propionicus]|nr:MAG: preprotein translocase subunit YajC [Desulfobulbus propionicus]
MTGVAFAEAGSSPLAGGAAGGFAQFIPLILIFVVFYFLLIRPQQKKAKEHQQYLANLKKGDRIITGGGIHGKITGLTESVATIEIAENVRIKVNRGSIMGAADAEKQAPPAKAGS